MICIVTQPIDLANYIDVWNLKTRFPAERVCHITWGNLSGMKGHETLYLLAHGSPTALENMSSLSLAKLLVSKGLTQPIKKIKLLVCASGVYENSDGGKIIPYCQKLADALVVAGGPATVVVGFDGATANTNDSGRTFAKDVPQPKFPNWNEFLSQYGPRYTQLNEQAERMPFTSEVEIVANAKTLQATSVDIFQWIYTNNKLYTLPSAKGKTYGIPGQTIAGRPIKK